MKKLLFIFLIAVNLSGCVGVYFSKNGDVVTSDTDFSRTNLSVRSNPPPRVADKINTDGSEMYVTDHERKWCGLTIWAIIPIPLWLPLCHVHTEVTYKHGKAIHMASQWPTGSGFLCGPFVPIMGIDGGSQGFCRSVK
jgi:hypothetical protein